jgi:Protein of unknown function (DUF2948)
MTSDARFADGAERALNLVARDAEDLRVLSALTQDAVLTVEDMRYDGRRRQVTLLINRFRWEDRARAERQRRGFERVRSVLAIEDVRRARIHGLRRDALDMVISLLSMSFTAGPDGTGTITLTFAGDGAVALDVEALEVTLTDVTRPYLAPSGRAPTHDKG